jgi:hypothetical protein
MSGIVLEDKASKLRWEGRSHREEEGKCQSLALIGTMVDLALVSFLAELGMTMFLFSDTLLLYSYVLRFKRKGDNVHTIGSIMILHLGIQEWSSATYKMNEYDTPLAKGWDYQIVF